MPDQTVFIVDDDLGSAASLNALMMAHGFASQVFHSAEKFLAEYQADRQAFLILDVRLGGMSGLELQKKLVAAKAPLSIIVISGHADESIRRQAIAQGAIAFLDKPFAGNELCELITAELT